MEALRRHLYSGRATAEDHARYRAAIGSDPIAHEDDRSPAASPPAAHPRRRLAAAAPVIAGVAGFAVLATVVALQLRATPVPPAPSAAPPARVAEGGPPPPADVVPVDDYSRTEFLQRLAAGGSAGIAAYLTSNRPTPGVTTRRPYVVERHGQGPQTIGLDDVPADVITGQATVYLVTQFAGWAEWTADGAGAAYEGRGTLATEASHAGNQEGGVPSRATFAFDAGARPVRLHIDVPAGVHWGVAVSFSR